MEIEKIEKVEGKTYVTVKVVNKFIDIKRIIVILDNIDDYFDKKGKLDVNTLKEEILCPRTYLVTIGIFNTCTCKNALFRKTPCRHIQFALENLNEK